MVESELRKQERLRSRKRNQFAVWSVIPAAAVVVIVGGLFWASVYLVMRPSVTTAPDPSDVAAAEARAGVPIAGASADGFGPTGEASAVIAQAGQSDDVHPADDLMITDEVDEPAVSEEWATDGDRDAADAPATARTWVNPDGSVVAVVEPPVVTVTEGPAVADGPAVTEAAAVAVAERPAADDLFVADPDQPRVGEATNDLIADSEWVVADSSTMPNDPIMSGEAYSQMYEEEQGPLNGPFLAEIGDQQGLADALAAAEASDPQFIANQATALAARNAELTARAQELASRAEDLTGRLEGLTAKIEELETRLSTTGANLLQPALVPSPQPLSNGRGPEVVAARATSTPTASTGSGTRAPWVVLPQPEPGSRVAAGPIVLETRARGESAITKISLQLDGVALQVSLDRRDDTTWRGRTTARVGPGSHTVAVAVVDAQGRTGSYKWQFNASS